MAKPKSDDKRRAIVSAAIQIIASQGLGAATATIAKEAGVSNGSLFTYFETKADLLNRLYIELKAEMAAAAVAGLPADSDLREQLRYVWVHWLHWATSCPEKRRVLAHLDVADEITAQSHQIAGQTMAPIATLLEQVSEQGAMRGAPLEFTVALMSGLADATIDFMIRDPADAEKHCTAAFEALWRMVA